MVAMKHLRLTGGGDRWAVLVCDGARDPDPEEIGTVTRNGQRGTWDERISFGLWSAKDMAGRNHGDRYLDRWGAARQLALGLGLGKKVQGL